MAQGGGTGNVTRSWAENSATDPEELCWWEKLRRVPIGTHLCLFSLSTVGAGLAPYSCPIAEEVEAMLRHCNLVPWWENFSLPEASAKVCTSMTLGLTKSQLYWQLPPIGSPASLSSAPCTCPGLPDLFPIAFPSLGFAGA